MTKWQNVYPTFFSQQVGVEAEVVDAEIKPSLSGHLALPVAAGVIVDQLLLLRHSKQLTKLGAGLLELVCVVVLLDIVVLVVLCNDALKPDGRTQNELINCKEDWGAAAAAFVTDAFKFTHKF